MEDQPESLSWTKVVANERRAILNLKYVLKRARKCDCSLSSGQICWNDIVDLFYDIWIESQVVLKRMEDDIYDRTRHL